MTFLKDCTQQYQKAAKHFTMSLALICGVAPANASDMVGFGISATNGNQWILKAPPDKNFLLQAISEER
jgi:hypothetical protein